ncbi:MAG: threonine/serine dehydratase [Longimicrobiales bacterium]|nr:threonine/serine dehydratase [Longimicrobiales bacterium]
MPVSASPSRGPAFPLPDSLPDSWSREAWAEVLRSVRSLLPPTPCLRARDLDVPGGGEIWIKYENLQHTGSFKVRGAIVAITALGAEGRERGVVACSSGNHGRAVAWVAGHLGVRATIFVPEWVDRVKLEGMRASGAEVRRVGTSYDAAAAAARAEVEESGRPFVHPFDDVRVVAGQGTTALEILEVVPEARRIVAPLSGGGLVGGIAAAVRVHRPATEVVAVSAERARVMLESVRAGRPIELDEEPTVASALSGGIELDNRVTFELVRRLVTRHLVVEEGAVERAMAVAVRELHTVVEGGGAVALAALLEGGLTDEELGEGPTVIVLSGGNVAGERLAGIVADR